MRNHSVPEPNGRPLVGHLIEFRNEPLACMSRWQCEYGDLVGFRLGLQPMYLLSHPSLAEQALVEQTDIFVKMYEPQKPKGLQLVLGQGLVTSTGALWQQQRKLLQTAFQRRSIHGMLPQMVLAGQQLIERWHRFETDVEIEIADEMLRLMLEVLTQTMFSTSVLDDIDAIAPALNICLRHAAMTTMNPFLPPLWVPTTRNRAFKKALSTLDSLMYRLIEHRRNETIRHDDLLNRLLAASNSENGIPMSDRQLRDELITIFTAGHETTANLMTWTLYLLARHPEALTRMKAELQQVLSGEIPDATQLERLEFTKAVLMESLRLRPPAALLIRKIKRDTVMAGYQLKAGRLALISIFNIHHHPELWDHPEQFNPNRFIEQKISKHQFLPFGMGPRFCLGNHFAMVESVLLLSMLAQQFHFNPSSEREPEIDMAVTLRPKDGLRLRVSPITDNGG